MKRSRELEVALAAVERAARVTRSVQSKIDAEALEKKDRSPVTVADFAAQALVCRSLSEQFPKDPVIGEEDSADLRSSEQRPFLDRIHAELQAEGGGSPEEILAWIDRGRTDSYSDRFWTLDPVDGTKGFLRREQYAIALGLLEEGEVELAALGCPNLDDGEGGVGVLFWAIRGEGAFARPLHRPSASPRRLTVSTVDDPAALRLCESVEAGHSKHDQSAEVVARLGVRAQAVRLDSQTKYGVVARGEAEVYLRLPTRRDYEEKIWDHAAGALIVQEAGGTVTDVDGRPLNFGLGRTLSRNRGVVVTNGPLHDRILATLRDIGV